MNYHSLAAFAAVLTVGLAVGLVLMLFLILRDNHGRFDIKYAMAFIGAVALAGAAFRWIITQ